MKNDGHFSFLAHAAWPAFVVEESGTIRHSNEAAIHFFGPRLESDSVTLSSVWAEAGESAEQFLARCARGVVSVVALRFRGKGGSEQRFSAHVCLLREESQTRFVFQLLPECLPSSREPVARSGEPPGRGRKTRRPAGRWDALPGLPG